MGRLDLDILFKQTTSEWIQCKFCKSKVKGIEGYIKINFYECGTRWSSIDKRVVVCNCCFKKCMDKITTATKNKEESYKKLVKTKILKSLK